MSENEQCPTWVPNGNPNVPHNERVRCAVKGPHRIGLDGQPIHTAGLHERYQVEKIHDPSGKHDDCRYFVLDPQHDPLARIALAAYTEAADQNWSHRDLVRDLRAWLRRLSALSPSAGTSQ